MAIRDIIYKNHTFHISYSLINNHAKRNLAFLHGWGSNKEIMMMAFSKSFKGFNHLYLDLPGFGSSNNEIFLDTYDYAKIIELFLQEIHINECKEYIVVGHSFGGKISLLLQREIILLSSSGILLPKPFKVKMKILFSKIAKFMGIHLKSLRANDAQNLTPIMYEVFKCVVNEDFAKHYADFKHKATIFWGKSDTTTPLEAYQKICELLPLAKAYLLEGDHYFFLQQGDTLERLYMQP